MGPLDHRGAKGAPKEDKVIVEKLNEFFVLVSMAEEVREIPTLEPIWLGDKSEELSHTEISIEEFLEQIDTLNSTKSPGPDVIHPRVLEKVKYEIPELLTVVHNLL